MIYETQDTVLGQCITGVRWQGIGGQDGTRDDRRPTSRIEMEVRDGTRGYSTLGDFVDVDGPSFTVTATIHRDTVCRAYRSPTFKSAERVVARVT